MIVAVILALVLVVGIVPCIVFKRQLARHLLLAGGRSEIFRGIAKPVDLTDSYKPNSAFSRRVPLYCWTTVPRGFQVFRHVPLNIDGLIYLWGSESANHYHEVFPEDCTNIEVHRKFQALYLCHTTFFTASNGTPVYSVVFNYADGFSETNDLCYGIDLLNWTPNPKKTNMVPENPDSKVAWIGGSFQKGKNEPIRFILTTVDESASFHGSQEHRPVFVQKPRHGGHFCDDRGESRADEMTPPDNDGISP